MNNLELNHAGSLKVEPNGAAGSVLLKIEFFLLGPEVSHQ